jgi:ubiquitin carboxyl-terminal hydrolase 12/46
MSFHARTPSLQALHQMQQQQQNPTNGAAAPTSPILTWVDEVFQGKLVNETRCLRCDSVTSRQEPFYDLSLEIGTNCSVTACLRQFSSNETLDGADKFSCDECGCKQEAQKRMRVASLPPVLCLHLKRFKYVESAGQMQKLTHRVVFPFHLKLTNTTDTCPDADAEYSLTAVVVHMGAHVNHGHYVALVKSAGKWVCFDDEAVHGVTELQVQSTFGHTQQPVVRADGAGNGHVDHAYILFYQKRTPGEERESGGEEDEEVVEAKIM